MDQNISNYRIAMRGKKWYFCLVSYMFDISINNAWRLQKICDKNPMDLLHFRRYITRTYLSQYAKPPHKGLRGRPQQTLSDIRYDGKTTGLYFKSSKPAALIAMQKPLQDVKNVISDYM